MSSRCSRVERLVCHFHQRSKASITGPLAALRGMANLSRADLACTRSRRSFGSPICPWRDRGPTAGDLRIKAQPLLHPQLDLSKPHCELFGHAFEFSIGLHALIRLSLKKFGEKDNVALSRDIGPGRRASGILAFAAHEGQAAERFSAALGHVRSAYSRSLSNGPPFGEPSGRGPANPFQVRP